MHSHSHRKCLSLGLSLLLAAIWLAPAMAQGKITKIDDSAFFDPGRIPVVFDHDAHNAKAGIKNCAVCHHAHARNGRLIPGAASVDRKCSDCHRVRPAPSDMPPALMLAFHERCQGCHRAKHKGPVACGGCHKR